MIFITLIKFKASVEEAMRIGKQIMQSLPEGVNIISTYWTLGGFDAVWLYEAPSEKEAMKLGAMASKVMEFQTLTALSREEAMKLIS